MKLTFLIAAITLWLAPLYAQQNEWKILLDSKEVNDLVIDGDIVWASTPNSGLVKINTQSKERTFYQEHNSEIPSNAIRAIIKGKGEVLWVGTNGGLAAFDGATWTVFTTFNSEIPSNFCNDLVLLWVATSDNGISRYDGSVWENFTTHSGLASDQIVKLAMDSSGRVYAASSKNVMYFTGAGWTVLPNDSHLAPAENQFTLAEQYESLACDNDGNVYAGTSRQALHKFNGDLWKNIRMDYGSDPNAYYLYAPVRGLAIGPNNDIWAGNSYALVQFRADTMAQVHLSNSFVLTVAIADEQSVWYGGLGATRFDLADKFDFHSTADAEIPGNQMQEIVADDYGRVWLTSASGNTTSFDGTAWKQYPLLPRGVKSVYPQTEETIWFAYGINGVGKLVGNDYTDYFAIHDTDLFYAVFRMTKDNDGGMWLNKRTGLIEESQNWAFHTFIYNLAFRNAQKLAFDKNNTLWIGSAYVGLTSYNGQTWQSSYNLDFDWEAESVWDFDFDSKGLMWCATNEGLISYDGVTRTAYPRNGISDDFGMYASLAIENDSSFWIGTMDGLEHFNGKTWEHYDTSNSPLQDNIIRDIAMDKNGNLWIGLMYEGVAIYNPGGVNLSATPTPFEEACEFTIVPNPAQDLIRVSIKGIGDIYQLHYTIVDIRGRTVQKGTLLPGSAVSIFDLTNGTYTIQVELNDGTKCQSRFIIQRK